MPRTWTPDEVLGISGGYQAACVLAAGAELDLFGALSAGDLSADDLAARLGADLRAVTILADALAAIELLIKDAGRYRLAEGVADALTAGGSGSVLHMVRHRANCMRRCAQLARVAKTGRPPERTESILGPAGDTASYVGAMHEINASAAPKLVAELGPGKFRHLLDVGGGPGTWTLAFLRAAPDATATLFDLPDVIALAERRLAAAGVRDRVTLVAGDLYTDRLPAGADLAWVSAIIHMNSRRQNRDLYAKVRAALAPGGRVLVRDVVMAPCRTRPAAGAMFAVNMLVSTDGGGTFTFEEIRDDLQAAGFAQPRLLLRGEWMNSVVEATRT